MTSYRWVIVACGALMTCVAPFAAVSIYSVEGLAGLGGRLLLGLLADRIGAKPELIGGLLLQSACIASYLFVNRLEAFYALAVVFGAAYGGVMPLARASFGQRIMGTVFGAMTMVSSIGMAFGPWAGRRIFDVNNSYAWLYLGASAIALAAALVALAFTPATGDATAAAGVTPLAFLLPARGEREKGSWRPITSS